jgi:hypothetical protein
MDILGDLAAYVYPSTSSVPSRLDDQNKPQNVLLNVQAHRMQPGHPINLGQTKSLPPTYNINLFSKKLRSFARQPPYQFHKIS